MEVDRCVYTWKTINPVKSANYPSTHLFTLWGALSLYPIGVPLFSSLLNAVDGAQTHSHARQMPLAVPQTIVLDDKRCLGWIMGREDLCEHVLLRAEAQCIPCSPRVMGF